MKVIDLKKHANAAETVKKEVCVHRMLNDPHVIRFYGRRENGDFEFIFLEYASGGELFDRIGKQILMINQLTFKLLQFSNRAGCGNASTGGPTVFQAADRRRGVPAQPRRGAQGFETGKPFVGRQ